MKAAVMQSRMVPTNMAPCTQGCLRPSVTVQQHSRQTQRSRSRTAPAQLGRQSLLLQHQRHCRLQYAAIQQSTASHADAQPATADETGALERQMREALREQESSANGSAESHSERSGNCAAAAAAPPGAASDKFQGKRVAVLQACKSDAVSLTERERSLAEYMTLPASQYSVLDAKRIERIDNDAFRCYVGGISFLSFKVEPVLTVSVVVGRLGPTVSLLETELEGSKAVRAVNDRFTATMTNNVRWRDAPETDPSAAATNSSDGGGGGGADQQAEDNPDSGRLRQITSDTEIKVTLEVPGWLRFISEDAISRTGSKVMQKVLDKMVPRFLAQLAADYELWAAGDQSRKPIGTGQL